MTISKVLTLPDTLLSNHIYLVKNTDNGGRGLYITDKDGVIAYEVVKPLPVPPTVTGNLHVEMGLTSVYDIVDYDITQDYVVSAELGSVYEENGKIYYTAPNAPCNAGFTVNGRKINVVVTEPMGLIIQRRKPNAFAVSITPLSLFVTSKLKGWL